MWTLDIEVKTIQRAREPPIVKSMALTHSNFQQMPVGHLPLCSEVTRVPQNKAQSLSQGSQSTETDITVTLNANNYDHRYKGIRQDPVEAQSIPIILV